jgi:hypothetical protein
MNHGHGKPYLGSDPDMHGKLEMNGFIHGLTRERFLALVLSRGEPLLFSSTMEVPLGMSASFFDGTRGIVTRYATRDEFLAWEQRLFPGCKTMLVPQDRFFVEVRVD